jgi:hypothetical protein
MLAAATAPVFGASTYNWRVALQATPLVYVFAEVDQLAEAMVVEGRPGVFFRKDVEGFVSVQVFGSAPVYSSSGEGLAGASIPAGGAPALPCRSLALELFLVEERARGMEVVSNFRRVVAKP